MSSILLVTSSPRGTGSVSTRAATRLAGNLIAARPDAELLRRDLAANPLPHIGEDLATAVLTPAEKLTPEQAQILAASDRATAELLAADTVVIAAGFINFSIPSTLKSWIDHVSRSQKTFRYGPQGPEGLATGKKVYVVIASTGTYTSGPAAGMDHARPYLKSMLGFLGMTDVEFINAEGVGLGIETDEQIIAKALEKTGPRELTIAA